MDQPQTDMIHLNHEIDNITMIDSVAGRLDQVHRRIRGAELAAGRAAGAVTLLAVSKTQSSDLMRAAWAAGQRAFGENYVQEALTKMGQLADLPIEWHFIGHLQTNKTRPIAEHFAWVHGLDDVRHARRLNDQRPPHLPPLNVCLEINLDGEAGKSGVSPAQAADLLRECRVFPRLRIRGFMAIPAPVADPAAARLPFARLRQLRDQMATPALPLDTLSMGMSGDLEAAIAEGATLVRVGTAIFGSRNHGTY